MFCGWSWPEFKWESLCGGWKIHLPSLSIFALFCEVFIVFSKSVLVLELHAQCCGWCMQAWRGTANLVSSDLSKPIYDQTDTFFFISPFGILKCFNSSFTTVSLNSTVLFIWRNLDLKKKNLNRWGREMNFELMFFWLFLTWIHVGIPVRGWWSLELNYLSWELGLSKLHFFKIWDTIPGCWLPPYHMLSCGSKDYFALD